MIIDTKHAIEKSNGNTELAKELFTMLINELPKSLENIKSSFQLKLTQDLLDHAHRLHGSTVYCGVPDLKSAACNLENSIKKNNLSEIQLNINKVELSIKLLIKHAPEILNNKW